MTLGFNSEKVIREYGLKVEKTLNSNIISTNQPVISTEAERSLSSSTSNSKYDVVVLAAAHKEFLNMDFNEFKKEKSIVYDVKGILNADDCDGRL